LDKQNKALLRVYVGDYIHGKGQADNMNGSENSSFTVGELLKRVEILMSHELKKFPAS